jgi:outer membrane protein assembly factor BamD (BamD/ComL family)
MQRVVRLAALAALLPLLATASGRPESGAGAQALFDKAALLVISGRQDEALVRYEALVSTHPSSPLAPQSQLKIADILHRKRDFNGAFTAFQKLITSFPASDLFSDALAGQMEIARQVLAEQDLVARNVEPKSPSLPKLQTTSEMLRAILANGPGSPCATEARYLLAVALDKEGRTQDAIKEFQRFRDLHPEDPFADDAAFQVAYIHYRSARGGRHELSATRQSQEALEQFLTFYPLSEKAPVASHLLATLSGWRGDGMMEAARFYERTGNNAAALIQYREILRRAANDDKKRSEIEARIRRIESLQETAHPRQPATWSPSQTPSSRAVPPQITPAADGPPALNRAPSGHSSPPPSADVPAAQQS